MRYGLPFCYRSLLLVTLTLLLHGTLAAQRPVAVPVHPKEGEPSGMRVKMPCNDAGDISNFFNFQMQSNSFGDNITPAEIRLYAARPDTIFLCDQDRFSVRMNNATIDLSGDPQPGTTPGVGYAFYQCPPTTTGPTIADIRADPCVADNGLDPFDELAVTIPLNYAAGNYDAFIANDGSGMNTIPALFGGDPVVLDIAPITFDDADLTTFEAIYEQATGGGPIGPCVNVSDDFTFRVAYLNPIALANLDQNPAGCDGSFDVLGGVPELRRGQGYTIDIVRTGSGARATLLTPAAQIGHGSRVEYRVPTSGTYNIIITDERDCELMNTTVTHDNAVSCVTPVKFTFPFGTGLNGESRCYPITVDNFTNVVGFQFEVVFDPAVLRFTGIANENTDLTEPVIFNGPPSSGGTLTDGRIRFSYGGFGGPSTIADGNNVFELCFDIVGALGDQSPLTIVAASEEFTLEGNVRGAPTICDGAISVTDEAFLVTIDSQRETCVDDGNGSITATASGIEGGFTFSIRRVSPMPEAGFRDPLVRGTSPASATWNGLIPGNYEVRVVNDAGVEVITPAVVDEGLRLTINVIRETDISCNGDSDGAVRAEVLADGVIVSNPVAAGYTFNWVGFAETSDVLSGLPFGSYEVVVTSPDGCTGGDTGNLGQPAAVLVRPDNPADAVTDATCSGSPDGSIEVSAAGGTGPYDFAWPDGLGTDAGVLTSERMNLLPGSYAVTVTDSRGCSNDANFTVDAVKTIFIIQDSDSITCNGDDDGVIRVNGSASGAAPVGNYFVQLNNLTTATDGTEEEILDNSVPFVFDNLTPGVYEIVLRDDDPAGCSVRDTVEIFEPDVLEIDDDLMIRNETCTVGMDGTARATVTGGTEPYTYQWFNDSLDMPLDTTTPGPFLDRLSADTNYFFVVIDARGCTDTASFRILAPAPAALSLVDTSFVSCPGDTDGQLSVTITPPPGETVTSIRWVRVVNGMATNQVVANDATTQANLPVGDYAVEVITSNDCVNFAIGTVSSPGQVFLQDFTVNNPQCPGDANGNIFVNPGGGTPNADGTYNYVWSDNPFAPPSTNPVRTVLRAGEYTVTITDANGCQPPFDTTFTLVDPPAITGTFVTTDVTCPNDNISDGASTFTASYTDGTQGTYDFLWTSGTATFNDVQSTETGLSRGVVTVRVTDGVCNESFQDTIGSPDEFDTEVLVDNVSCNGQMDGAATINVTGGTGDYTFAWNASADTDNMIDGLAAGTDYQVVLTDENGCTPDPIPFVVREPDPLTLAVDPVQTTPTVQCNGDENGVLSVFVSSVNSNPIGDNPYTWSGGIAAANSSRADDLAPGSYSVTVTDLRGCQDSLEYTIGEPEAITFSVLPIEEPACFGETTNINIDTAFGGTADNFQDFSFTINNDGFRVNIDQTGTAFAGEIVVSVFDAEGCSADQTFSVGQPPQIIVDLPEEITVELGDSLTRLNPIISPAGDVYDFRWTPATFLSADSVRSPTVFPFEDTDYDLTVTNANGCQAFGSIFVNVDANRNVYIPNAFTPNRDGRNDQFRVFACQGVRQVNRVQVYDRWGGLMFSDVNLPPNCLDGIALWDGTGRNGKPVNPGVFVYFVEVAFLDNRVLTYRGDITVVR